MNILILDRTNPKRRKWLPVCGELWCLHVQINIQASSDRFVAGKPGDQTELLAVGTAVVIVTEQVN